jgi:hypothetical protein
MSGGPMRSIVVAMFLAGMSGCGSGVYEQRMANTQALYNRLALRNQHLRPETWTDGGGIRFRLPKNFEELPGPVKPEPPKDGEPADPILVEEEDPRQPRRILNTLLPGLRGAFKYAGEFSFLYVLSSKNVKKPDGLAESVIEQPGSDPLKFNADVCAILASAIMSQEFDYSKCAEQVFPRQSTPPIPFVQPVTLKTAILNYHEPLETGETRKWTITLYFYEGREKDVQACIMTLEP